jgi:hypothetical protein
LIGPGRIANFTRLPLGLAMASSSSSKISRVQEAQGPPI